MSNVKHRIFIGHSADVEIDGILTPVVVPGFTFDSEIITFDQTNRTFDETG